MEAFEVWRRNNNNALNNFRQISPAVQNHLKQVYLNLCCLILASAIGAYLHVLWNIGGILTTIGCMGSLIWFNDTHPYEQSKRLCILFLSAFLNGASDGPLINLAIDLDSRILITAFVGTSIAFACFSVAAMLARRREYIYLGAYLSSAVCIHWGLQFATWYFYGSVSINKPKLVIYYGLLIFVVYIIVETQEIIEKAEELGDMDYVEHCFTFFSNFFAVFVRILTIMLKNSLDKEQRKKQLKLKLPKQAHSKEC